MKQQKFTFNFEEYPSIESLYIQDQQLFQKAISIRKTAYAPYSKFNVGAAILLDDNTIVTGNNQENAAYPSGLCAERVAIFHAASHHPNKKIIKIAITADAVSSKLLKAVPPCGACRQSLYEYEYKQKQEIEIIFGTDYSKIYKIKSLQNLLPFSFNSDMM
ncbi:MAG: cytidine deaminase [Flavobacteriales bacterium]